MKNVSRRLAGWLCCALISVSQAFAATDLQQAVETAQAMSEVKLLDREVILRGPSVFQVKLAPDGNKISYLKRQGADRRKLSSMWLYDVQTGKTRQLFIFKNVKRTFWAGDSSGVFLDIGHGVAFSGLGEGDSPKIIARLDNEDREKIMDVDHSHDVAMIVRRFNDDEKKFELHRLDGDGNESLVYKLENEYSSLSLDDKGEPDLLHWQNRSEDAKGEVFIYDAKAEVPKRLWQCDWDDDCHVYHFDRKSNRLLLKTNRESDLIRLVWADVSSGKLNEVHSDPQNYTDLGTVAVNGAEPLLTTYQGDFAVNYGLTAEMAEHLKLIEKQLGRNRLFFWLPRQADPYKSRWLIWQQTSRQASTSYHLYDPQSKSLTQPLKTVIEKAQSQVAHLQDEHLAPKFAIRYPASDGYMVPGYLVLPRGVDIKTAPLVVKVHGGPWARVDGGISNRVQLLANRGYIVFEPNFRASEGFGKKHMLGIKNDFGDGRVQQDITDGVKYLLANGIGDRSRVAIVGHSFGGYSTLAGLAVTPELYKVGFAGAPPTDLGRSAKLYHKFEKKVNSSLRGYFMKQSVVDWEDKAALAANFLKQPLHLVDKVTKPMVIWAGKHDRRVFIVDVNDYASKAGSLNKKVSLFVDDESMHGPSSQAGNVAYMYLMEKTLAMHLGGKLQPLDKQKDKKLYRTVKRQMKMDHVGLID